MKASSHPVALIAGAAISPFGDNIGAAAARSLAKDHQIAIFDQTDAEETLRAFGIAGTAIQGDISNSRDCAQAVSQASTLGPLKVLINAAGITKPSRPVEQIEPGEWDDVIRINLTGAFLLCQAAIPAIRTAGGGSMVLISSRAGRAPFASHGVVPVSTKAHYAASKAGIISLTRSLALELAADGIRVNCVAPGPVKGAMMPPETWELAASSVPLGRVGEAREIAETIRFLVSPAASYITGHTLDANGGQTLN